MSDTRQQTAQGFAELTDDRQQKVADLAARLLEEDDNLLLHERPHDLYRIYDDQDRLLYIGCARDWAERIHMHEALRGQNPVSDELCHRAAHIKVAIYRDRAAGRAAEKAAIKDEAPHLNREHNSKRFKRVRGVGYVPTSELPELPPMTEAEVSRGFTSFLLDRLIRASA